jgi:hypothetical protein
MTRRTVPHTRPAPQRRPGVLDGTALPINSGRIVNTTVGEWVIRRATAHSAQAVSR